MENPLGNELVKVIGVQNHGLAAVEEFFTTQQIADLGGGGGGGGVTSQQFINSGTTDTITGINTFAGWNSATTGAKTETIPTSTGSLGIIIVSDLIGTAGAYPITIVPVSGNIIGGQNQIYTNFSSLTLLDTTQGWAAI